MRSTVLTGIPEFSRRMRSATLNAACSPAAASRRIVAARMFLADMQRRPAISNYILSAPAATRIGVFQRRTSAHVLGSEMSSLPLISTDHDHVVVQRDIFGSN